MPPALVNAMKGGKDKKNFIVSSECCKGTVF
ncbi:hypothetical protein DFP95_11835 [Cohnella lupini]|uniref:Uncharacterized protein n=1 Tax=Cohnella lupini TaxID=1294267 RepID=A0A3D9I0Y0_9BACL|nr:hypothetical protein DFP95_11835 [Cohnella lupini]